MQRFCYLICQNNWCQNTSKLIYQKSEILLLWDTQNLVYCKLISMCDVELADDRNQVDAKIDRRQACFFFETPGFPFYPHVPFCPDLLYSISGTRPLCSSGWMRKHAFLSTFVVGHQRIILTGVLSIKCRMKFLIHSQTSTVHRLFHPTLYWASDYISMLGLRLLVKGAPEQLYGKSSHPILYLVRE